MKFSDFVSSFVVIWTLITRIPLPKSMWPKIMPDGAKTLSLVPAVGGVLGFITGVFVMLADLLGIGQQASVWCGAAFYAMAGWSLHLDGWGDMWDGIGSCRRGEELRAVMKDSHIGAYGVTGLILAFGLWTGLLLSSGVHKAAVTLMITGSTARFGVCVAAYFGKYPWESGMAKGWVDRFSKANIFTAFICALPFMPFAPLEWILSIFFVSLVSYLLASHMNKRLGGVNGDILGASAVAGEIVSLAVFALRLRLF